MEESCSHLPPYVCTAEENRGEKEVSSLARRFLELVEEDGDLPVEGVQQLCQTNEEAITPRLASAVLASMVDTFIHSCQGLRGLDDLHSAFVVYALVDTAANIGVNRTFRDMSRGLQHTASTMRMTSLLTGCCSCEGLVVKVASLLPEHCGCLESLIQTLGTPRAPGSCTRLLNRAFKNLPTAKQAGKMKAKRKKRNSFGAKGKGVKCKGSKSRKAKLTAPEEDVPWEWLVELRSLPEGGCDSIWEGSVTLLPHDVLLHRWDMKPLSGPLAFQKCFDEICTAAIALKVEEGMRGGGHWSYIPTTIFVADPELAAYLKPKFKHQTPGVRLLEDESRRREEDKETGDHLVMCIGCWELYRESSALYCAGCGGVRYARVSPPLERSSE
ncbi:unnamed protein product [Chrysoparadoxa australica]